MTQKPKTNEKPAVDDVRSRIASDAGKHYEEKISVFFSEALDAEKVVWADCSHCHHRVKLTVPDWSARVRALELLLNQGFGRVSSEAETSSTTIFVERMCACRDVDQPGYRAVASGDARVSNADRSPA